MTTQMYIKVINKTKTPKLQKFKRSKQNKTNLYEDLLFKYKICYV